MQALEAAEGHQRVVRIGHARQSVHRRQQGAQIGFLTSATGATTMKGDCGVMRRRP